MTIGLISHAHMENVHTVRFCSDDSINFHKHTRGHKAAYTSVTDDESYGRTDYQ